MIVTAGGKTIAPTAIESRLMLDPLIEQACVVGEGERFLAALIVPNPTALRAAIKQMRLWVFSRRGALHHKKVLALVRQAIDRQLADMASHEQIGRFQLLDRGFTPENGELTPKLSLRRSVIAEHLQAEVRRLFDR
jgi:long-chain acyl-CoA synthetase